MFARTAPRLATSRVFARKIAQSTQANPTKYNSFGSAQSTKVVASRPTSPHVTIYKFPLPAITSIVHRATGVGLAGGKTIETIRNYFFQLRGAPWLFFLQIVNSDLSSLPTRFASSSTAACTCTREFISLSFIFKTSFFSESFSRFASAPASRRSS